MKYPQWLEEIESNWNGHKNIALTSENVSILIQMAKDAWDNNEMDIKHPSVSYYVRNLEFRDKYSDKPKDWLDSASFKNDILTMCANSTTENIEMLKKSIRDNYKEEY